MKILVTGGAGFIGSQVVDRYLELGHEVVIIDNLSTGRIENINQKAKFYEVDIRNAPAIQKIFAEEKPDILNHHAAQMNVRKSVANPVYDCAVNLSGLLNLLEASIKNKTKKVIFASSGGVVYGDASIIPTKEDYEPKMPLSPYGVAKLSSEHYLYYYLKNYGLQFVALRYANVYGPRQDPAGEAGVIAIFSQKLLNDEQPIINGDGEQTRDYVYIADVVEANILALDKTINSPINIGTGIETPVNKIFRMLNSFAGNRFQEKHGSAMPGEQRRSSLDCTKAKNALNWSPKVNIAEGFKETFEWFAKKQLVKGS